MFSLSTPSSLEYFTDVVQNYLGVENVLHCNIDFKNVQGKTIAAVRFQRRRLSQYSTNQMAMRLCLSALIIQAGEYQTAKFMTI